MNPDTLERLLIDRDARELPPDTLELLSAYLETKPEAAREASQIEETLRLAKDALTPRHQPALPPRSFKSELRVLEHNEPSGRFLRRALAMAACFVCGLFAGWFWLRANVPAPEVVEKRVAVAQIPAPSAVQKSAFWSVDRLYRSELTPRPSPSSGLVWESPVKQPQLKSPL